MIMNRPGRPLWLLLSLLILATMALAACGGAGETLASNPTPALDDTLTERPASRYLTPPPTTPQPVVFPADDGPHDNITEWWYYTGHLTAADGHQYGFEFVIFQILPVDRPPAYSAHLAITDIGRGTFQFDYRGQTGGQLLAGAHPIDLTVDGWTLVGGDGQDRIHAGMDGYSLDLQIQEIKPPVLHNKIGYFEITEGIGSYYYSRTRMAATGTLTIDGTPVEVTGQAWSDRQWGNFYPVSGWDWFSLQLDDGRDIMLWRSHDQQGNTTYPGWGTLVDAVGTAHHLDEGTFDLQATEYWTSLHSGGNYPAAWTITIPSEDLQLSVTPVLKDQELRIPSPYSVIYWEGAVNVSGTRSGQPISGKGYVELTGYALPPSPNPSANPAG
jgi:predicted secreted hydrolase